MPPSATSVPTEYNTSPNQAPVPPTSRYPEDFDAPHSHPSWRQSDSGSDGDGPRLMRIVFNLTTDDEQALSSPAIRITPEVIVVSSDDETPQQDTLRRPGRHRSPEVIVISDDDDLPVSPRTFSVPDLVATTAENKHTGLSTSRQISAVSSAAPRKRVMSSSGVAPCDEPASKRLRATLVDSLPSAHHPNGSSRL